MCVKMGGSVFKLAAGFPLEKKESALYWYFDQLTVISMWHPEHTLTRS